MSDRFNPYDDDRIEQAVRNAMFAADTAALDLARTGVPLAQTIRCAVETAVEALVGHGAVEVTPMDTWPEWWGVERPFPREPGYVSPWASS